MITQITIEEMKEEEKEAVRHLLMKSYSEYKDSFYHPTAWKEYSAAIQSSIDNPHIEKILVAKIDQQILGTLQLFESSEKAYQRPELQIVTPIIRLLAVDPEARGRGVAQELLKTGVLYARSKGASKLYLHSGDVMQKAIRLYEWLGFKRDPTKEFINNGHLVKCYRLDF